MKPNRTWDKEKIEAFRRDLESAFGILEKDFNPEEIRKEFDRKR